MRPFLDTNILVYAQQNEPFGPRAREIVRQGGAISVQVLNEFTSVLRRKMQRAWPEIEAALADIVIVLGPAAPLTTDIHAAALALARDHNFSFYDALIVAAAQDAGCDVLYTQDMQHGRELEGLRIVDPFR